MLIVSVISGHVYSHGVSYLDKLALFQTTCHHSDNVCCTVQLSRSYHYSGIVQHDHILVSLMSDSHWPVLEESYTLQL